ncbi:MAG TPA: hypothetical protein VF903_12775 [Nitrospirota bacterium]
MSDVDELGENFAEVEKRVKALASENRTLKGRVRELEQELSQALNEARNFASVHGKQEHIRQRIEQVLQSLESLQAKK